MFVSLMEEMNCFFLNCLFTSGLGVFCAKCNQPFYCSLIFLYVEVRMIVSFVCVLHFCILGGCCSMYVCLWM
jgi:hypothetical protein